MATDQITPEAESILAAADITEQQLNAGEIPKNLYYDKLTELIFRHQDNPSSVCLDVGCHEGALLDNMQDAFPMGTFYGFEPLPHLFEYLQNKYAADNSVTIQNVALSDKNGEATFNHVVSNPGYSGLIKRRYDRPTEEDCEITVKTVRMDDQFADQRVDVIKVDVEGAELQVFRGGEETIRRNKPVIVFEHGLGAADCYGTTPEMIYDLLVEKCGLKINLLIDYLRAEGPLTREQFSRQFNDHIDFYYVAHPAY
ncbi:FkbM family methyltransferase [Calycomorphotria hydatis]|uniref:2-O-methyltransferase NoeI n=1 Tax=Calycomorphotria hydatis TaxID=2528027 RepID=A0A517T7B7_9PLAN|nr:FkbM family methyltransferase [Calycomorphotria hydatis]QDT64268.1 2-O-methyltransferase NoeI [Calycomorphotria hydatis]